MRIVIIGAVAAGTSAAAKARRNDEEAEIVIYERDSDISYSGCGMPYYISGHVKTVKELVPRDPAYFKSDYNVDVFILHDVLSINTIDKTVTVKNLVTGDVFRDKYDKLVIATGARSSVPPIKGVDGANVFTLRNISDMKKIKSFMDTHQPKSVAIIGTGFIGLEMCESFKELGIRVTLIEKLNQVTPGLDSDMAEIVKDYIEHNDVVVMTGATIDEISETSVILSDGKEIDADMVLVSTGVRPNVELAKAAGIELGETGAIKVDVKMMTNIPDIYSCGDCSEQYSLVTGKPVYRPLGSTANKTGRITGDTITGKNLSFRGILGTGIFRVFDLVIAQTGLSEREAKLLGYDTVVCHNTNPNKPEYMGGKEMTIKAIADKATDKLLGVQIVGFEGVDKRIDVFVTAITFGAKAEDLFHLDLAYAPPFATTKDPVMYTGMILDNVLNRGRKLITPLELEALINSGEKYNLIDARVNAQYEKNHIDTAVNIPKRTLRCNCDKLDKDAITVTYCNKGNTGNAAQNMLLNKGMNKVYNLSGGHKLYSKLKLKCWDCGDAPAKK